MKWSNVYFSREQLLLIFCHVAMTWTWIQGSISRAQKKCKCCQHTDIATCPSCPINLFFFFPFFELIHINEFKKLLTHTEPIWNVAWLGKMSTELKKNCSQDFSIMHNEFNFFLSKCMQLTALGKNILWSSHWCYFTCMSQYKPEWPALHLSHCTKHFPQRAATVLQ